MLRAASARVARPVRSGRTRLLAPVESLERRTLLSAGDLDLTFGGDGKVTTDFPGSTYDRGRPIAVQADGKIVQAGWYQIGGPGGDMNFSVVRLTPEGILDTTFGDNGRVVIDFDGRGDIVNAMAIGPDGKIVVAGSSSFPFNDPLAPDTDVAVARLNPDGSLDTTFDGDGKVRLNYGTVPAGNTTSSDFAWNMTLDAAGKVILAGSSNVVSPATFALSRLNLDGSPDATFGGGDGIAAVPLAPSGGGAVIGATAYAVTTDAAGRIIAAGSGGAGVTNAEFVVARYNPDGTLDSTFDADGFALTPIRTANDFAGGVAVAADGRIIAGGYTTGTTATGTTTDVAAARYNSDGSLDTTFGGAGTGTAILVSAGRSEFAFNMRLDAQGRPTFAGRSQLSPSDTYAIAARFTADGLVDFDFGGDGIVQLPAMDDAYGLAIHPTSGDVYVGGVSTPDDGGFDELSVAHLDAAGSLFLGFGDDFDGVARTDVGGPGWNLGTTVAVQPDGKTVVAGSNLSSAATDRDIVLARYNVDGSPDNTFGAAGRVSFDVSGDLDNVTEIAVDAFGRIVGVGWTTRRNATNQTIEEMLVFRLNPDGSRDFGFGFGGYTVVPNFDGLANTLSEAFDLALLPDGRMAVVGDWASAPTGATFMMAVAVFDTNGFLDPSFTGDGMLRVDATNSILNGRASFGTAVAAYPDGAGFDLVVGGYARASSSADDFAALVRLNLTGTFDNSFDLDGKLTTAIGPFDSYLDDLAVDPAGRIVVAGYVNQNNPNGSDMAVARFLPSGAFDNAFDGDGRVITDFVGRRDQANSVLLAPDGSIFVGGFADITTATTSTTPFRDFAVAKYTPAGALDTSFGGDGKVTTDFAGDTDSISDLALTPDGKLVAAGTATARTTAAAIGTGQDLAAVRYLLVDTNTPPVVSAGADATARRGLAFTRTGQFTDPDADTWTATVDYGDGAGPQPLTLGDDKSFTLDKAYTANGTYTVTVNVTDGDGAVGTDTFVVTVVTPTTLGRRDVFYNRSRFDGGNAAITAQDFDAVALGKQPLLPGQAATFANYTSYVRGVNGIMVDFNGHSAPAAQDFAFRVKDPAAPGGWAPAPAPLEFYTVQNAGAPGSVAAFTFPDGSIRNTWLEVTVLANERTGLLAPQTFYWGNLVGDTGNHAAGATSAVVNVLDQLRTRTGLPGATASVTHVADFNRDGRINAIDTAISRSMQGRSLELITVPAPATAAGAFADGTTIGRGFVARRRQPLLEL